MEKRLIIISKNFILPGWMQQQNFLLLPDAAVKQEPVSPSYADLTNSSVSPPPNKRYTPSPNPNSLHPTSISPNIPIQGISHQQQFDMMNYIPSVSPLQNANILNQPYQGQTNQGQFHIPNATMVNAAVNFMNTDQNHNNHTEQRNIEDILTNNNLDNINQLDNAPNPNNENVLESVSAMNISSLLDLDSQQQINTNELLSNDLLNDLIKNLDNNENQGANPMTINAIQNTFDADEENMTDSFKQISIE